VNIKPCDCHTDFNRPAIFRIHVRGRISPTWRDRFEGMTITTKEEPDGAVMTTLLGTLSDQAAFVGIINSLHDLRLGVFGVECMVEVTPDN
jgi:hypothetical protein